MSDNQRVRLTKQLLGNALIDLLSEKSIHKISIREICERAEINRTTFYKYYGSQYDLLSELENEIVKKIDSGVRSIEGETFSFDVLIEIISFLDANSYLCKLLLNNNIDPEFPGKIINLPCIREMIMANMAPEYTQDERDYIFEIVIGGSVSLIQKWLNREQREPPEVIGALMGKIILKAIMA